MYSITPKIMIYFKWNKNILNIKINIIMECIKMIDENKKDLEIGQAYLLMEDK